MLKDIECQPKALKMLTGTLKKNKLPSAILMSGQKGVGKRLAAINYAKAINCLESADFDSCDICPSCKKTDSGIHPDIHTIEPTNDEIKIDSIRRLEEVLSLKPFEGRKKIVIIDDSDRMNANAANAFLKTLEEPPDNSIIILISSNEDSLPATIISRCVRICFSPLPSETCKKIIFAHIAPEDINLYMNLSMGRPGIAVTRNFSEEKTWFLTLLENMISDNSKEIWSDREQMKLWLDLSIVFIRDAAVYEVTGSKSETLLGEPCKCESIDKALDAYNQLQEIRNLIDFNINKSITWNHVSGIMKSLLCHA